MSELLQAVDALLTNPDGLPPPEVRSRLRRAEKLTQEQVARALNVKRVQVSRWETGAAEPRGERRVAYVHLLKNLSAKHPDVALARLQTS